MAGESKNTGRSEGSMAIVIVSQANPLSHLVQQVKIGTSIYHLVCKLALTEDSQHQQRLAILKGSRKHELKQENRPCPSFAITPCPSLAIT